jgi:hypothetical protein
MFLFDFFRSLLPLHNPIGFGAADFIELALAALIVLLLLGRAELEPLALRLAARPAWCMAALAALVIVLRLALLPVAPVPTPAGTDDFSYLLLADTLRHFRMANPPHAMSRFFEADFILQHPTYASIFPLGQGLAIAVGWVVIGAPWAGVLLSVGVLCGLCFWALRGWTTPGWSLVGALFAVMQFGPLCYWTNTYWGGAISGIAGCLVFGALPRLRAGARPRDAALLGAGLGIQLLSRPFEFLLMVVVAGVYLVVSKLPVRLVRYVLLAFAPAALLMLAQNYQVTGSITTLPYELSRYQYGIPTTFAFQPNPIPHSALTFEQQLDYQAQKAIHDGPGYFERLTDRTGFLRFFVPAPIYLVLPLFLLGLRERRVLWVAGTLGLFILGDNFYPYFYPHYVAALSCLFLLVIVTSLERLSKWSGFAARLVVALCGAQFLFWYGIHGMRDTSVRLAMARYESWNFLNQDDPEGRIAVNQRLEQSIGQKLVFVRYSAQHGFHEWIHNEADIGGSSTVWALDLGAEEDHKLMDYYPQRSVFLCEPDTKPVRLVQLR